MHWFFLMLVLLLVGCGRLSAADAPETLLQQWIAAAQQGDYATARRLSSDSDLVFALWQGANRSAQMNGQMLDYRILATEQNGAAILYTIQWIGDGDQPDLCTQVEVDTVNDTISSPYAYIQGTCGVDVRRGS